MKKVKKLPLLCVFALLFALISAVFGAVISNKNEVASADGSVDYSYAFHFEDYNVTYDIGSNRKINVEEYLTICYDGFASTGFIKDIPVNAGEQVKNVKAYEMVDDKPAYVWHDVYTESVNGVEFMCVDVGDTSNKYGEEHTYLITYTYCLTKAQEGKNVLALNAIGTERAPYCTINNATVTLVLPDGYLGGKCFIGTLDSENQAQYETSTNTEGRTVLTVSSALDYNEGVTFKLDFENGALSTYFDFTPYWFVIVGAVILLFMIAVKFLCFNKSTLIPVVNYDAPGNMDPLLMGKLIDNKVNSEDVSAMVFYWADKGYLKINFDSKDDPTLIRTVKALPESCPQYEQIMFANLFAGNDMVKPSQLRNVFYRTVQRVTTMVNSQTKGLYSSKSIGISIIFALIGGLLFGIAPMVIALTQISSKFLILYPFILLFPGLIIYALSETIMYNRIKFSKSKILLFSLGIALVCAILTLFYSFIVPTCVIGIGAKIALCLVGCAIIAFSVIIISRTQDYTKKLNDIVGFRKFIQLAEKRQLEKMLEDDPQFYYHILPYAQVLGVSDKWEEKFKDLTVMPPQWATSSSPSFLEFYVLNRAINNSFVRISQNMISRPSSSGGSGHGGFSGGGHVGGGHGGGGFRGR